MILVYLLILLVVMILLSWLLFHVNDNSRGFLEFISAVGMFICGASSVALAVGLIFFSICYVESGIKAELINREYGTDYTRYEVMFAEDIIDTVRQIKRQRIEINGNLLQDQGD